MSGLESVRVQVLLDHSAKDEVSAERVKDKCELLLRKSGIAIRGNASTSLTVSLRGDSVGFGEPPANVKRSLGDEMVTAIMKRRVYTCELYVWESVVLERGDQFRHAEGRTWRAALVVFTTQEKAESSVLETVEQLTERFSNAYLANQAP